MRQEELATIGAALAAEGIASFEDMLTRYNALVPPEGRLGLMFHKVKTLCVRGEPPLLAVFKRQLEALGVVALAGVAREVEADGSPIYVLRVTSDVDAFEADKPAFRQALTRLMAELLDEASRVLM